MEVVVDSTVGVEPSILSTDSQEDSLLPKESCFTSDVWYAEP